LRLANPFLDRLAITVQEVGADGDRYGSQGRRRRSGAGKKCKQRGTEIAKHRIRFAATADQASSSDFRR
jgi:hypothetical protein